MLQRLFTFHFPSILLLLIFLFSQQSLLAQPGCPPNDVGFENGSFENVLGAPPPDPWGINHAFGNNWVVNWFDANGAADLASSAWDFTPSFTAFDGQYMAQLFTGTSGDDTLECYHDAIFTEVDLKWYDHYELSFHHRNATTANTNTADVTMEVWLTAEQTNVEGTGVKPCDDLTIPPHSELLWSSTNFNNANWSQENICFRGSLKLDQLLFVIYNDDLDDETDAWYIDAVCLESIGPAPCAASTCPAPVNLNCAQAELGGVLLSWNQEPNATEGYEIQIEFSDPECCTSGFNIALDPIYTMDNFYVHPIFSLNTCFSWQVRSRCTQGVQSDWSEKSCFSPWQCYPVLITQGGDTKYKVAPNSQAMVFPNPSSGDFNFQLNTDGPLTIDVEIYSSNGQLIKSFPKEYFSDGNYRKNWTSDIQLPDGLYYVFFNTNFGIFQEKLILHNSDFNK